MNLTLLERLIEQILSPYAAAALALADGRVLHVQSQTPSDHGTLPAALTITTKYFSLNEGDLVILNDPYSGGSTLNYLTFVACLREKKGSDPGLLIAVREKIEDAFAIATSLEQEGVRIPPTPIRNKGQINEIILQAIAAHPLCPKKFLDTFSDVTQKILVTEQKVKEYFEQLYPRFNFSLFDQRLEKTHQRVLNAIAEFPYGESRIELQLDSGETLKLHLEVSSKEIRMDFGGTSAGKNIFLTDHATIGICYYAISHHFGFANLSDSGSYSFLQVIKPTGCFLNAKYPQPVYRGIHDATAILLQTCEMALLKLHTKSQRAQTNFSNVVAQIEFADKKSLHFILPSGAGAQSENDGANSIFISSPQQFLSVQQIEERYPVKIIKIEPRLSLGGKGKTNGGRGLTLQLQVLDDALFTWSNEHYKKMLKPIKNQSPMDLSDFEFIRNNERKTLDSFGRLQLQKNDFVILSSGTGSGLIE